MDPRRQPMGCLVQKRKQGLGKYIIAVNLCAKGFHNLWLVEPFVDPSKLSVTERSIFAWNTDIVRVLSCSLVGSDDGIVAVDSRRNTWPDTLAIVTAFNEWLASRERVVHSLTLAFFYNGWPATIAASHRPVVFVLREAVGKTVTDQDRFQIDVSLLVTHNLRREYGYVMSRIRLSGNMKILMGVLREQLEKEGE